MVSAVNMNLYQNKPLIVCNDSIFKWNIEVNPEKIVIEIN